MPDPSTPTRPHKRGRILLTWGILATLLIVTIGSLLLQNGQAPSRTIDRSPGGDPVPASPAVTSAPEADSTEGEPEATAVETVVIRVIDGQTIVVEPVEPLEATNDAGDEHIVTLQGIAAPTGAECGAQASSNHLLSMLPAGERVIVDFDARIDPFDDKGNSQGYVLRPGLEDVNQLQVGRGYAMPWQAGDDDEIAPERVPQYRMAADTAVSQRLGIHGDCTPDGE